MATNNNRQKCKTYQLKHQLKLYRRQQKKTCICLENIYSIFENKIKVKKSLALI